MTSHPLARRTSAFIALSVGLVYLCFLGYAYRAQYFAPDVRLYQSWGEQHFMARDGYSTLFIRISAWMGSVDPAAFIWLSAALMAFAMSAFIYTTLALVRDPVLKIAVSLLVGASGIWFYLFGKTFYDFPFTILNLGTCLLLLVSLLRADDPSGIRRLIYWTCVMAGFMLSWKPYNVFECWALLCVAVSHCQLRERVVQGLKCKSDWLSAAGLGVLGFTIGNYGLFVRPMKTLLGLSASSYQSNLYDFLFTTTGPAWDGVNFLGFNDSVILIGPALLILFVLPILSRGWLFLACSAVTTGLFLIFIRFFTPGFPWHGFTMGSYILVMVIFLANQAEVLTGARRILFVLTLLTAAIPQVGFVLFSYVPKQMRWNEGMDAAVSTLTGQADPILRDVREFADQVKGTFDVTCDIKRSRFVSYADQRVLLPAHQAARPEGWQQIWTRPEMTYVDPAYLIRISVDAEAALSDVLPSAFIPFYYRPVSTKRGEGYFVTLYEKNIP